MTRVGPVGFRTTSIDARMRLADLSHLTVVVRKPDLVKSSFSFASPVPLSCESPFSLLIEDLHVISLQISLSLSRPVTQYTRTSQETLAAF